MALEDAPLGAGLGRRCLSLVYEILLVAAVVLVAGFVHRALFGDPNPHNQWQETGLRLFLLAAVGLYFVPQWANGGQTLSMKTWRLRIVAGDGQTLTWRQAVLRYLYACLSCIAFGLGFVWALFDRDRQFWHDRVAGTRIVRLQPQSNGASAAPPTTSSAPPR